jgi:hypothetical protein
MFYVDATAHAQTLSYGDVLRLGGPEAQVAEELLRCAFAELQSRALPQKLRVGSFQVVRADLERARVSSYNGYDPLELPRELYELLPRFDGRPLAEVRETISTGDGVDLDDETLRKLCDFGILERA